MVALWIALGLVLRLSANAYLLLGIPLTAAFQWGVRRQSLRGLWVREAPPLRLGARGWFIAAALAAYPCFRLIDSLRSRAYGVETAWYVAAIAGSVAAAYSLVNFKGPALSNLWLCLATAGVFGILIMALTAATAGVAPLGLAARVREGVASLLLYVPVVFVLEEVSFRGAFDAHVHHPGDGHQYLTAFLVAALWGLWHIPVALGQNQPLAFLMVGLVCVHCAIGVPLSIFWRRSGNLFVPGFTHALIDAVRNAMLVVRP